MIGMDLAIFKQAPRVCNNAPAHLLAIELVEIKPETAYKMYDHSLTILKW